MDRDLRSVLFRLGWNRERQEQLEALADPALVAARVSVEHRGAYGLAGSAVDTARLAGHFHDGEPAWPAVGDWVAVRPAPGGGGVIEGILPRKSLLERRRPGVPRPQPVAANVDRVLVVTSAEREVNRRRVERYLAVVWASGARPVVVLNKADLSLDVGADLEALRASAGRDVPCLATSAATGAGLEEVRAQLAAGITGALVGPSGVGKSSLLNRLFGEDRQATTGVRLTDAKGRHTTTRRELFELPGDACLIDTPGMRELGLWEAAEGIEQAFTEVEDLAAACRFRDCRHTGEPGCAVTAAVDAGALSPDRLASYDKLRREEAFQDRQRDPRTQLASKGRWKVIHKQQRARKRIDPKLRDD